MAGKDAIDFLLDKDRRERLPDLETLALALKCHRAKSNRRSILEVAEELGMGKDSVYRRLSKFEELFGPQAENQALYDQLEMLLNGVHSLLDPDTLQIRVGASRALAKVMVPNVVAPFIEWCDRQEFPFKVEVELVTGLPGELRKRGEEGDLDLLAASCEVDDPPEKSPTLKADISIAMRMIVPRGHHRLSELVNRRERVTPEALRGMTVVQLEPHSDRRPLPKYPADLFEHAREIRHVRSYEDMHNIVKSGGDLVGFSYAEVLDHDEQKKLDVVPLPQEYSSRLRICLIRPAQGRLMRTGRQVAAIDELQARFKAYLERLEQGVFAEGFVERLPKEWSIFHVRPTLDGDGEEAVWSRGDLSLNLTRDGFIKGTHVVGPVDKGERKEIFDVFGQAIVNPRRASECHLVWQGRSDGEIYVANFICSQDDLETGDLCGFWSGRMTGDPHRFRHSAGYMVIVPKGKDGGIEAPDLIGRIDEHGSRFGRLSLATPGRIVRESTPPNAKGGATYRGLSA